MTLSPLCAFNFHRIWSSSSSQITSVFTWEPFLMYFFPKGWAPCLGLSTQRSTPCGQGAQATRVPLELTGHSMCWCRSPFCTWRSTSPTMVSPESSVRVCKSTGHIELDICDSPICLTSLWLDAPKVELTQLYFMPQMTTWWAPAAPHEKKPLPVATSSDRKEVAFPPGRRSIRQDVIVEPSWDYSRDGDWCSSALG